MKKMDSPKKPLSTFFEKNPELKKICTFFVTFACAFIGFVLGLSGLIVLIIFGGSGFLGGWLGYKIGGGFFDKIIKWSNLFVGLLLPFLGIFSASYAYVKFEKGCGKSYLYLCIWSVIISIINAILGTIQSFDESFDFTSEAFLKKIGTAFIISLIIACRDTKKTK